MLPIFQKMVKTVDAIQASIESGRIDGALLDWQELGLLASEASATAELWLLDSGQANLSDSILAPNLGYLSMVKAPVTYLNFFESDASWPDTEQRHYAQTFSKSKSRYIKWDVGLERPLGASAADFQIKATYYRSDGEEFATFFHPAKIQTGWTSWWHSGAAGWEKAGMWKPGRYTLELYVGDEMIANGQFEITDN